MKDEETPTCPDDGSRARDPALLGTDRFDLRRKLGLGAFGEVYEAFDRQHETVVAIKSLRRMEASALLRFKRGFRALANLRHPNVVQLYELLSVDGSWFLTMERLEGVNFVEHVTRARRRTPPAMACDLDRLRRALPQLAAGVCALHDSNILHRDLKPSNVWVTSEARVVLLDFDLAKEQTQAGGRPATLAGTPHYMAPELAMSAPATQSSDWWSVGVMLYEALTGTLPLQGDRSGLEVQGPGNETPAPSRLVTGVPKDLDTLTRDLLRRQPESRPSGAEVLRRLGSPLPRERSARRAGSAAADASPLVARSSQLEELERAFDAVEAGRAVTVQLRGRSGVGKTSLVRHFLERLRSQRPDAVVLTGRCHLGESVPYKALDELVDDLAGYLSSAPIADTDAILPRNVHLLVRLFPVLQKVQLVGRPVSHEREIADPRELRRKSFTALRELFARLADRRPLVLFIDDVQWGDGDSGAFVRELMAPPDPPSVLLLLAHRSDDVDSGPFLSGVSAREDDRDGAETRVLELGELSSRQAEELAAILLSEEPSAGESVSAEAIARESRGNPFFIHELVRYARSRRGGGLPLVSLETAIGDRVSRLPPPARQLLEVVAVAGRPLRWSVARRAGGQASEAHMARDVLLKEHLLRSSGSLEREEVEVYHDRVRESIVAAVSGDSLKLHHERLAQALIEDPATDPERLLTHFHAAGDDVRAAHYAVVAAEAARSALAFGRAARLYRLTLELGAHGPLEKSRLRRALGDALADAGRGWEAAQEYLEAAHRAEQEERPELRRKAADQLLKSGRVNEGVALLRELCREQHLWFPDKPWQVLLAAILGRTAVRLNPLRFVEKPASRIASRKRHQLDLCWTASFGMSLIDSFRASYFHSRFLLLSLRVGDPFRFAMALAGEVANSALPGGSSRRRSERLYARASQLALRLGHPRVVAFAKSMRGTMAWLQGDWREALELNESAGELYRAESIGFGWERSTAEIISLSALSMLGEWKELSRRLPSALKEAVERGDLYASVGLRLMSYRYFVRLAADEPEGARDEILGALKDWPSEGFHVQHCDSLFGLVDISLYRSDGHTALELLHSHWSRLVRSQMLHAQLPRIFASALRARAALAAAAAVAEIGSSERRRLLREAGKHTRRVESEKMPWSDGWVLLLRAGHAAENGERNTALELLERAEKALEAASMPQFAAAARRRRGEILGGDEGNRLLVESDRWMRSQEVSSPARLSDMLAPGGWRRIAHA